MTAGPGYPFRVGSRSSIASADQMFKGCISEVQVFNRALTPAEIKSLYHADPASRRKPNP